ncbi:MAG: molybdopterin-dependent oxidoreductase, partial [Chlorobiales bacterium]|nr:molybdopterin-dependent oxidoreductase [Chlorobiales bacterium]
IAQKIVDAIKAEGPHTVNFPGGHSMTRTIGSARSRITGMFGFDSVGGPGLCWDNLMFGPMITLGDYYHAHVEDFLKSKLIVVWGHNKALAMPSEWSHAILKAKYENGAKIVVIDPRFTESAEKADLYLPVRPGTDAALALGIANVIITENLHDKEFIAKNTVGFEDYKELALQYTPEKVEQITWCPADRIRTLARWYATIKPAMLEFGRGGNFTAGNSGWLCSRGATCLIGLTGQVGVSGSGFSVENSSFSPSNTGFSAFPVASLARKGDPLVARTVKAPVGAWGAVDVLYNRKPYGYRVLYAVTEQVAKNPDQNALEKAFMQIPFVVVEQRFINWTGSRFADIILPNALWTEQAMMYGEYTHIVCTGPAVKPMFESKPSYLILAELGDKICQKLGLNLPAEEVFPWRTDESIINAMFTLKDMPLGGYPALNYKEAIQHPEGYRMPRYHNQAGFLPYHEDNDPAGAGYRESGLH